MSIGFVLAGSTSISRLCFLEHATTGAVTGLTYSGVTFYYSIDGADWTSIDPVDGHLTNFVSDGFKEATGAGGWYRVGLRNALFTSAAKSLKFKITRDSDSAELFLGECIVNAFDLTDADPDVNLVKWKGTAPANLADTDKVPSSVQHMANDVITSAATASGYVTELANAIEAAIANDADMTAVVQTIADRIAADWVAGDSSPLAIVAALKADAQWSNLATIQANLTTILGRLVGTIAAGTHQPQGGDSHAIVSSGTHGNAALLTQLGTLATSAALALVKAVTDKLDTALVLDGAVYKFTANALEEAPTGGGGEGDTLIVAPIVGEVPERQSGVTVPLYTGERQETTINVVDGEQQPVDFTAIADEFTLTIRDTRGNLVQVASTTDDSLEVHDGSVSFVPDDASTTLKARILNYSLRQVGNDQVWQEGPLPIKFATPRAVPS